MLLAQQAGSGVNLGVGQGSGSEAVGAPMGAEIPERLPDVFSPRRDYARLQLRRFERLRVRLGMGPPALLPDRLQVGTQGLAVFVRILQIDPLPDRPAKLSRYPLRESCGVGR